MAEGRSTEALSLQGPLVVAFPTILAQDHTVGNPHHGGGCGSRSPPQNIIAVLSEGRVGPDRLGLQEIAIAGSGLGELLAWGDTVGLLISCDDMEFLLIFSTGTELEGRAYSVELTVGSTDLTSTSDLSDFRHLWCLP